MNWIEVQNIRWPSSRFN